MPNQEKLHWTVLGCQLRHAEPRLLCSPLHQGAVLVHGHRGPPAVSLSLEAKLGVTVVSVE